MSRIAIFSDIHGHYGNLLSTLHLAEDQGCTRFICLGDIVEGNGENENVILELVRRQIPCIRGNHDEFHDVALSPEAENFLKGLPESIAEDGVLYTHISPRDCKKKPKNPWEAWNVFDETDHRLVFVGHIHIPLLFGFKNDLPVEARDYLIRPGMILHLDPTDRYIACPGSLAASRDGTSNAYFMIFDSEELSLKLIKIPVL